MNVVEAYARMQHCRDLATFYRRWATSEAAGMPLNSMLSGLREGGSAAVNARINHLSDLLQAGSMDVQAGIGAFTTMEASLLEVGRASGNLDGVLGCLADLYESDYRTVSRARRKMTYPMMVAFCGCWIPTLPLAFLVGPGLWIATGLLLSILVFWLGGVLLWRYFVHLRSGPRWAQVRFFWALATSLEAGVHLDQALALSAETTAPSQLSVGLRYLVPQGRPIADLLRSTGVFDEAALNMIDGGEVAGRLPESLRQAARYMEVGVL